MREQQQQRRPNEAPPASIDLPPPPLDYDLTKQALPIVETKEVDGSETDPAKVVEASDTNLVHIRT